MPSIFGAVPSDDGWWFVVWTVVVCRGLSGNGCSNGRDWLAGAFTLWCCWCAKSRFLVFGGANLVLVGVLVAILVFCAFFVGNLVCIGVLGRQIHQGKGVLFV